MDECCDVCYNGPMGWPRLVGSLKLQVSLAKEPYERDDILQKRPVMLRSLRIVATPYYECDAYVHNRAVQNLWGGYG